MWFGFGLITAGVAFGLALRARLQANWKGQTRHFAPHGQRHVAYAYQSVTSKARVTKVRIGVTTLPGVHFQLREEGKPDLFFKWLGISEEMQTLDAQFDPRLYLESDAIALRDLLREQPQLRAAILRVFDIARANSLSSCRLRCTHGRLWVEFTPARNSYLAPAERQLVAELLSIAGALQQGQLSGSQARDPFVWRAAALLAISTATAVLGGLGLIRSLVGRTDILEPWHLFAACVPLGLALAAAFLLLIVTLLRRSSRAHVVLIEAAIVGSFGFITATFALAREANIEFDTSTAQPHELHGARVEHQVERRRRRTRHTYYLHAPDWRAAHSGEQLQFTIDATTFQRLEGKDSVIVVTRQGALAHEWIEGIIVAPEPE